MLRKRQNPSPNWADKLMFEIYARFGLFIPLVAFVSFCNNIGMPNPTSFHGDLCDALLPVPIELP